MRIPSLACALATLFLVSCAEAPATPTKPKGPLGMSQDNPLRVEKMSEEVDFINSQKCGSGGHWRMGEQSVLPTPQVPENTGCMFDKFTATCSQTGERGGFYFLQCL